MLAAGFLVVSSNVGATGSYFAGQVVHKVDTRRPLVALTFDDGPNPPFTGRVLDTLRDAGVQATFFLIGENVRRYPELARRIVKEGHAVGNHSYSHRSLQRLRRNAIVVEIDRADAIIQSITGVRPRLLRPPYGALAPGLLGSGGLAARAGHLVVMWSVQVADWRAPSALSVAARTLRRVRPGSIVLLHDGGGNRHNTVEAVRWMVGHLALAGYEMVTVPELLVGAER